MAIEVAGKTFRTLSDEIYADGEKVVEAWADGTRVYPDEYPYCVKLKGRLLVPDVGYYTAYGGSASMYGLDPSIGGVWPIIEQQGDIECAVEVVVESEAPIERRELLPFVESTYYSPPLLVSLGGPYDTSARYLTHPPYDVRRSTYPGSNGRTFDKDDTYFNKLSGEGAASYVESLGVHSIIGLAVYGAARARIAYSASASGWRANPGRASGIVELSGGKSAFVEHVHYGGNHSVTVDFKSGHVHVWGSTLAVTTNVPSTTYLSEPVIGAAAFEECYANHSNFSGEGEMGSVTLYKDEPADARTVEIPELG